MAGPDFYIAQGDTSAPLVDTLLDAAGDPVDIAGASVDLQLAPVGGGAYVVNDAANNDQVGAGDDGTMGDVSYDWEEAVGLTLGDTDTPGYYFGRWVVTFAGGEVQSFPNGGFFLLQISADNEATASDAFATSTQLEARLGLSFTADEHGRATTLLGLASDVIRAEFGSLTFAEDDSFTVRGDYASRIRVPQRPLVEVASVTVNGELLDADSYYIDGDEIVRSSGISSSFYPFGSIFAGPLDEVEITYSHGWEDMPGDVAAICLEIATRVWVNPGSLVGENVAGVQSTYGVGPGNGLLMTDAEKKQLRRALYSGLGTIKTR